MKYMNKETYLKHFQVCTLKLRKVRFIITALGNFFMKLQSRRKDKTQKSEIQR